MALRVGMMFATNELKYILLGGAGMFLINSFTGLPIDYWNVCSGAWAYGLVAAWIQYPEAFQTAMTPA